MITFVQNKFDQEGRRAMKIHQLYNRIFAFLNVISMAIVDCADFILRSDSLTIRFFGSP